MKSKYVSARNLHEMFSIRKLNFSITEQIFPGTQALTSPTDMASSGVWEDLFPYTR